MAPVVRFRRLALTLAAALVAGTTTAATAQKLAPPASYVNPFIGTGGHGHVFPGATVPFGMVQLSPDTGTEGWDWCSGYHYSDHSIMGFSHTHLSGTGCADLGNILFVPQAAPAKWKAGPKDKLGEGYRQAFDHKNETAEPGYYRVKLASGITAELTATPRAGLHRYTFPASADATLLIDLAHKIGMGDKGRFDGEITVESPTVVTGWQHTNGWSNNKTFYFVAEFSHRIVDQSFQVDGAAVEEKTKTAKGTNVKGLLTFGRTAKPLQIRVGLSPTSIEQARKNLAAEVGKSDFDAVRVAAGKRWNNELSRIAIETPDTTQRRIFYTALYHTMIAPNLYNDVDRTYVGVDRKVVEGADFDYYSTFSLWDTFRAANPLFTLIAPERINDFVKTMVRHSEKSLNNQLPIWTLCGNDTWCMIGYHSVPVIVDAYFKGFRDFDVKAALSAMKSSANAREDHERYAKEGYVASGGADLQGSSRTLEYAYDDWCIAQFAEAIGAEEDAKLYRQRAQNYRKVWDPEVGFMRGRDQEGKWLPNFDPADARAASFTEGNAWQYTWSVMQDIPGLIELMGGPDKFAAKLDALWVAPPTTIKEGQPPDVSGLIGQYAHGNEPSHHVAYLYDFVGQPWKTQERVREILTTLYHDNPDGLSGNEDCGQMSAWYVWSALGLYPVNPASGIYMIGAPLFPRAAVSLAQTKKTFTVEAANVSPTNLYIQSATLNGQPLDRTWVTHQEVMAGGKLAFVMGPKPNKTWGTKATPPATGY